MQVAYKYTLSKMNVHLLMCPRSFTICAWNYYCPYYYLLLLFVTPSHFIFNVCCLHLFVMFDSSFPGSLASTGAHHYQQVYLLSVLLYLYARRRHLHAYVIFKIFITKLEIKKILYRGLGIHIIYLTTDVIPISPNSPCSTVIMVVVQYFGVVRWWFDGGSGG